MMLGEGLILTMHENGSTLKCWGNQQRTKQHHRCMVRPKHGKSCEKNGWTKYEVNLVCYSFDQEGIWKIEIVE